MCTLKMDKKEIGTALKNSSLDTKTYYHRTMQNRYNKIISYVSSFDTYQVHY